MEQAFLDRLKREQKMYAEMVERMKRCWGEFREPVRL